MFKFLGTIFFLLVPSVCTAENINSIKFQVRNITISNICGNPKAELAEMIFFHDIMAHLSTSNTEEVEQEMSLSAENLKTNPPTNEDCKLSNEIVETLILKSEIQNGDIYTLKKESLIGISGSNFHELKKIYSENPENKTKLKSMGGTIIPPATYSQPYYVYLVNKQDNICQIKALGDDSLVWTDCENLIPLKSK